MVTFDCHAERVDGVTLVTATVSDVGEPTRITVRNCLDGPVWPPRRQGVPEAGWDDDGFEAIIEPATHALGYATPAPPADRPAELVAATPVPAETPADDRLDTAGAVVRELGDPTPPADAVPTADPPQSEPSAADGEPDSRRPTAATAGAETSAGGHDEFPRSAEQQIPESAVQWLDPVTRRVDRAEQLAAATSLSAATTAVRAAGGLSAVRTVADRADADERMLRALARRAERLADRRAAVTVPVETLARLA